MLSLIAAICLCDVPYACRLYAGCRDALGDLWDTSIRRSMGMDGMYRMVMEFMLAVLYPYCEISQCFFFFA